SGQFIKVAAIATFVATWLTLCCAALRSHGMGCIAGLTIVWGTWLLCSPVLVNLLVWPESVPPFLMSTAVVLLSATAVRTGSARGIGLSAIVMSITNGSGWLFLPAVLLARVGRLWSLLICSCVFGLLVAVMLLLTHVGVDRAVQTTETIAPASDLRI